MATQLTPNIFASPGDLSLNTVAPQAKLGTKICSDDGREYRYCLMGATAGVPGKLYQSPAETTAHQDLAVAAAAIGASSVVTTTTVTVTANQYAGGWVMVTVTPGQGYQYKIKSHPATTAAVLTLTLDDTILIALTTSSRIDLVANPFSSVVVNPATATSSPIGAAVYAITAAYYGWLQVHGPCNLLNDGGSTVGTNVSASNATAGSVEAAVTAQAACGYAMTGIATTEYGPIFLQIE
jgi:hypothetical protein